MRRFAKTAGLLSLALALSLAGAELFVRALYHDLTTTSPIESWFGLRWQREQLRFNARGYRDREVPAYKPPGRRRMIVIGDSFTVAMGIAEEDRFPNRIERALRGSGADWEVFQFARLGHEFHHHVNTLQTQALPANPDFVLLQWYVNDFEISKQGRERPRPPISDPSLHNFLYRHSAFYTLLTHGWFVLQVRLGLSQDYAAYFRENFGDPRGERSLRAMDQLGRFFALAKIAGVPVGMVLFPNLEVGIGNDDYPFGFLHDRVLAACARHGVTCVDLRKVFVERGADVSALRLNRFDHHASAFAHALAADALMQTFAEEWQHRAGP